MNEEIKTFIKEIIETFLICFIFIMLLYMWVAVPELVWGSSMEPNFHTGERIVVEKITKHYREYQTGDIVVLNPPNNLRVDYIKRVIGIPGDVIKILGCNVYITRENVQYKLKEPYLMDGLCTAGGPAIKEGRATKLDSGYYFLLGDNRDASADSRYFGLVKRDNIVGRVVFRFWPIRKIGFI